MFVIPVHLKINNIVCVNELRFIRSHFSVLYAHLYVIHLFTQNILLYYLYQICNVILYEIIHIFYIFFMKIFIYLILFIDNQYYRLVSFEVRLKRNTILPQKSQACCIEQVIPSNMTDQILHMMALDQHSELFYVETDRASVVVSAGHMADRIARNFGYEIHLEEENQELIKKLTSAFRMYTRTVVVKDVCSNGANTLRMIIRNAKLQNIGNMPLFKVEYRDTNIPCPICNPWDVFEIGSFEDGGMGENGGLEENGYNSEDYDEEYELPDTNLQK